MSARLIRIAAVYLAIGVTMGIVMGITQQFSLAPVHAHVNLLGWASLGIMGVIYHVYPAAAQTRLARIHFWVHNVALPLFMVGLAFTLTGHEAFLPLTIAGALAVAIAILVFVANIWRCVRPAQAPGNAASAVRAAA
ncbi:MAG TPA: cytochrome-c oxidase [Casimicrobiaceae bacterium]